MPGRTRGRQEVTFSALCSLQATGCGSPDVPYHLVPNDPWEPSAFKGTTVTKLATDNALTVELTDGSVRWMAGERSGTLPEFAGALQLLNDSCAVQSSGTFECFGAMVATQVKRVAPAPYSHSAAQGFINTSVWCYVHQDGTAGCHCDTMDAAIPLGTRQAQQVALAGENVCLLLTDGTVSCWNLSAVIPGPDTCAPVIGAESSVGGIAGATQLVGSPDHGCALVAGNQVRCWGANGGGQLGDGTTTDSSVTAVSVLGDDRQPLFGVVAISTSSKANVPPYSCALLTDHSLRCWGHLDWLISQNYRSTTATAVPQVGNLSTLSMSEPDCGIRTDGSVLCWGGTHSVGGGGGGTGCGWFLGCL